MTVFIKYSYQFHNQYWTGRGWSSMPSQAKEYSPEKAERLIAKRFWRGILIKSKDGKLLQRAIVITT